MGMIRKTLSIGTFGTVSFRSKKEKLKRAERAQHEAEVLLDREHSARTAAEASTNLAKKCQRRAERRSRRNKKTDAIDVAAVTRRAARRAKKGAQRSMAHAKDAASTVRTEAAPHVHAIAERATEMVDHLTSTN